MNRTCARCGACCVAPDISTLTKPLGTPCSHLDPSCTCSIYDFRPDVCRRYLPDDICDLIAAATLEERVDRYLEIFGVSSEDCNI